MTRYVSIESVRTACGVTTQFISDDDMEELLNYMEYSVEQYLNTRFLPYTTIEQYNGSDSERLVVKNNPILKIRKLNIDGTDIDIDEVRYDSQGGLVWLNSGAEKNSFISKSTERNLVRIQYDYGLLEETTTQTTTSADEVEGDSVVVAVTDATGFEVDDYVLIEGMDSKREVCRISAEDGNNLTVDNLAVSHESESLFTKLMVPKVAERLMIVACSMAAVARVVGQSFDEITAYNIEGLQISKGEPYTQWREVTVQLKKEWVELRQHFRNRPAIM